MTSRKSDYFDERSKLSRATAGSANLIFSYPISLYSPSPTSRLKLKSVVSFSNPVSFPNSDSNNHAAQPFNSHELQYTLQNISYGHLIISKVRGFSHTNRLLFSTPLISHFSSYISPTLNSSHFHSPPPPPIHSQGII